MLTHIFRALVVVLTVNLNDALAVISNIGMC